MGDGLQRADDYTNRDLAAFLRDVTRGGIKEVTDEYFMAALGWPHTRRYDVSDWAKRFASRHSLIMSHDAKIGRFKFIRSKF